MMASCLNINGIAFAKPCQYSLVTHIYCDNYKAARDLRFRKDRAI
jgi:hypothetical protein